jgi:outer membrane protein assembly factor BamB
MLLGSRLARSDENWPRFRGPGGCGQTSERDLPITWGGKTSENVLWKAPLVGHGAASPIVWGQRLFVCTAFWPPSVTQRDRVAPEHHVLCYDARNGKLLWNRQVPPGPWVRGEPSGGYAAPTPTTDGKLVYCVFGSAVIAALDFQGKIAWRKEINPHTFDVNIGSSPVLYQDTAIMLCAMGEKKDSKVVAYDKTSGAVKWEHKLKDTGYGHSTPVIIQVQGKPQMLILASGGGPTADGLQSLDPADGKRLWWCWASGDTASPAVGAGIVYGDSGRGGPGVAVDPGGTGNVAKSHTRWKVDEVPAALSSPVIAGGYVYRLQDSGVLTCWKAASGETAYTQRLEGLSSKWASPVADPNGNVFFANAGKSVVIKAGGAFKILATNDLGDGNDCSPAVALGRMFLAGTKNVYCIGKK